MRVSLWSLHPQMQGHLDGTELSAPRPSTGGSAGCYTGEPAMKRGLAAACCMWTLGALDACGEAAELADAGSMARGRGDASDVLLRTRIALP